MEKGPKFSAHILFNAVVEQHAKNVLFPNWKEEREPLNVPVAKDKPYFLLKGIQTSDMSIGIDAQPTYYFTLD